MRKLMWFAIGFCAACILGVAAYSLWEYTHWLLLGAFLLCAGLLLASKWLPFLKRPAVVSFGLVVGLCWFSLYDGAYLDASRNLDGKTVEATLEISDYAMETDYGCSVSGNLELHGKTYQTSLYLNDSLKLKPGDRVSGIFRFRFTFEGGQSDPTYHPSEGVFLLAYQSGIISVESCDEIPARHFPAKIRREMENRIDKFFSQDTAPFAKALLLGNRYGLDYETNTAFKLSGLSHVVAVSGLHVSILFSLLYLVTARKRLFLFLLGLPMLLLFAAVTGFTPSVVRACIMQALVLLALLLDKEYDPPTALAFSGLVMLICNPTVILSISFQLTMTCMIGIFLFSEPIRNWLSSLTIFSDLKGKSLIKKMKRWFVTSVSVSASATVFTTPLVAYHFGAVSLISLLSNLLLVWMVNGIFYGIMLSCALGTASVFLGRLVGWLFALPIRIFIGVAKLLAKFPLAAVYTSSIYIVLWLVFAYILLAVYLLLRKKKPLLLGSLCIISLCVALMASWAEPLMDSCRVTVLNVGQGQSILLQSQGKSFLVDCGGDTDAASADAAAEALLSQGVSRLDGLIVTHYDEDHAGGIVNLLGRVPADRVFLPEFEEGVQLRQEIESIAATGVYVVNKDLSLTFGDGKISIFAPETPKLENECSICVLFQTKNCDILITGDRGLLGEKLLLSRTELPKLDVLIAGHHGSNTSTGMELLERTEPEYVFISVGERNRYGHPGKELLVRLDMIDCTIYRTDQHGTIIFRR